MNVPVPQPERLADCAEVWEAVVAAEAALGHSGRVLLRPSGTEPFVRVMVEARAAEAGGCGRSPARGGGRGGPGAKWGGGAPGSLGRLCAASSASPARPTPSPCCSARCTSWSTAATTRRGWPWWSTAGSGGPGRRRPRRRSPRWPSGRLLLLRGHAAAIGHTRWATHGAPTEENAHPHVDCTGRLALIHNGIIENHAELRDEVVAGGHTMTSGTDTEVMVHLIEDQIAGGLSLAEATRVGAAPAARLVLDRGGLRRRAGHDRGGLPADAPGAGARGRGDVPGLRHPGAHRAHAPDLHARRRPAGRAHARRHGRDDAFTASRWSPSSGPSRGTSRRRRRKASRTSCPRRCTSSPRRSPTRCLTAAARTVRSSSTRCA